MTPDTPPSPRQELEARLTALLLGELIGAEAAGLHDAIAQDVELARLYERLKRTNALVRETAAAPAPRISNLKSQISNAADLGPSAAPAAPLQLDAERRQKLLTHFKTVRPKEFARARRRIRTWLLPLSAAAGILVLSGWFALENLSGRKYYATSRVEVQRDITDVSGIQGNGESQSFSSAKKLAKPRASDLVLTLTSPRGTRQLLAKNEGTILTPAEAPRWGAFDGTTNPVIGYSNMTGLVELASTLNQITIPGSPIPPIVSPGPSARPQIYLPPTAPASGVPEGQSFLGDPDWIGTLDKPEARNAGEAPSEQDGLRMNFANTPINVVRNYEMVHGAGSPNFGADPDVGIEGTYSRGLTRDDIGSTLYLRATNQIYLDDSFGESSSKSPIDPATGLPIAQPSLAGAANKDNINIQSWQGRGGTLADGWSFDQPSGAPAGNAYYRLQYPPTTPPNQSGAQKQPIFVSTAGTQGSPGSTHVEYTSGQGSTMHLGADGQWVPDVVGAPASSMTALRSTTLSGYDDPGPQVDLTKSYSGFVVQGQIGTGVPLKFPSNPTAPSASPAPVLGDVPMVGALFRGVPRSSYASDGAKPEASEELVKVDGRYAMVQNGPATIIDGNEVPTTTFRYVDPPDSADLRNVPERNRNELVQYVTGTSFNGVSGTPNPQYATRNAATLPAVPADGNLTAGLRNDLNAPAVASVTGIQEAGFNAALQDLEKRKGVDTLERVQAIESPAAMNSPSVVVAPQAARGRGGRGDRAGGGGGGGLAAAFGEQGAASQGGGGGGGGGGSIVARVSVTGATSGGGAGGSFGGGGGAGGGGSNQLRPVDANQLLIVRDPATAPNQQLAFSTSPATGVNYPNAVQPGSVTSSYDPESHQLVIMSDAKTFGGVKDMVAKLDSPRPQAIIDGRLVRLTNAVVNHGEIQIGANGTLLTNFVSGEFAVSGANNFAVNGQGVDRSNFGFGLSPNAAPNANQQLARLGRPANPEIYLGNTKDESKQKAAGAASSREVSPADNRALGFNWFLGGVEMKDGENTTVVTRTNGSSGSVEAYVDYADNPDGTFTQNADPQDVLKNIQEVYAANPSGAQGRSPASQNNPLATRATLIQNQATPAPSKQMDKIASQTLVQDARRLYESGKLDQAEIQLAQARRLDPENFSVTNYFELIQERREADAVRTTDEAARIGLLNVDQAYDVPLRDQQKQAPNNYMRTNLVTTSKGRQNIKAKLDRIKIDSTKYDGQSLSEVVSSLRDKSLARDPDGAGVNFMFDHSVPVNGSVGIDPATGLPLPAAAPVQDIGEIPIRMGPEVRNLTLAQVLDAVVKSSPTPIEYKIEDYAVMFSHKPPQTEQLETQTFHVDTNTFVQGLANVSAMSFGAVSNGGGAGTVGGGGLSYTTTVAPTSGQQAAISFFKTAGVDLSAPGRSLFWNDRKGTLLVRASPAELAIISNSVVGIAKTQPPTNATPKELDRALPRPAAPVDEPQPEVQTRDNAFSTFSLNVADVSFKLAAASLEKGLMPEAASVRSEEFLNAFNYRDPAPLPGVPVAFASERARYPFAQNRDLLRFSLQTAAQGREPGRPLNLVLLLDKSGSMERADRVAIIGAALRVLAAQLQPQDTLSIITFARTPRLWVDGISGRDAAAAIDQVLGLTPEGGTNLEEAMNLAYATALRHYLASGVNRVVLLTDGAANLGNVDPAALKQQVEANRKQGVALDCFGVGWEGYNDDLLEVLARNGDGRYGFINTPAEAATDFAAQLAGALHVAAADVKVQVEFNPARVSAYRQIGYAKHQLTKQQFRDNTVDAAELAAAESGNALYVVEVNPAGTGPLATVRVRFKVPGTADYREHAWDVPYTGSAVALDQAGPAMRLAATASAFAEWLVSSPYAAEVTPDALLGYLRGVPEVCGADTRPKQLEWMIRQAKSLTGK